MTTCCLLSILIDKGMDNLTMMVESYNNYCWQTSHSPNRMLKNGKVCHESVVEEIQKHFHVFSGDLCLIFILLR